MNARYAKPDGRKVVYSSLHPVKLFRNANIFTYAVVILPPLFLVAVAGGVILVIMLVRRVKRKRRART